MSVRSPDARELSPAEMAQAIDWIDGALEPEAAIAFELELSSDPELARQVEQIAGVDAFLRSKSTGRALRKSSPSRWIVWTACAAVAAAALILIALAPGLFAPRAPRFEVALAPSFALAEDWVNQQPGLEGASAPGIAVSRGPNPRPMSAEDFLRESDAAEATVVATALAARRVELEAGWFVVPIELEVSSDVLVLGFNAGAGAARLFPPPSDPHPMGVLHAGRTLLPSARAVSAATPDTLEFRPGFLVPLGARKMTVLVAAKRAELKGLHTLADHGSIDARLAQGSTLEEIAAWLTSEGYACQSLVVREPQ